MPEKPAKHHFAEAAKRHYEDGAFLHDDDRLSNADHHFGFAAECALKSLLLRFTDATLAPRKPGGKPAKMPYVPGPAPNRPRHEYGHLPWLPADVALLTHGRQASRLTAVLGGLSAFDTWSAENRYRDGTEVSEPDVTRRRTVAKDILAAHEQALITGRFP